MGGGGGLPGLQTAGEGAPQGGRTNQRSLTHRTLANRRRPFYSRGRLGEVLWDSGNIPWGAGDQWEATHAAAAYRRGL